MGTAGTLDYPGQSRPELRTVPSPLIETAPVDEAQVNEGDGAMVRDSAHPASIARSGSS